MWISYFIGFIYFTCQSEAIFVPICSKNGGICSKGIKYYLAGLDLETKLPASSQECLGKLHSYTKNIFKQFDSFIRKKPPPPPPLQPSSLFQYLLQHLKWQTSKDETLLNENFHYICILIVYLSAICYMGLKFIKSFYQNRPTVLPEIREFSKTIFHGSGILHDELQHSQLNSNCICSHPNYMNN